MDKRATILASVLVGAVVIWVGSKTVYPAYVKPLLTYDVRIAKCREQLHTLNADEQRVSNARYDYKEYIRRVGSFDIAKVENELRQQLNTLIEKYKLKEASVSPSRATVDRKTGIQRMVLTIQADGPLQGVAGLMKEVAELPQLLHFGNVSLTPGRSTLPGGRMTLHEQVSLRMPIEIVVLPRNKMVGDIDTSKLDAPEPKIRHRYSDYSELWAGRPFSDYQKPEPLTVDAGGDQTVQRPGRNTLLRGKISGGIGEYTILWTPSEGIAKPSSLTTSIDTSQPGEYDYTLTVTDESGARAEDTMKLTINELPIPAETTARGTTPRTTGRSPRHQDNRWRDGKYQHVVMVLGRTYGDERLDEAMVYDRRSQTNNYFKAGDDFDGGKLIYVHQTGLLVLREGEYYVYPLGDVLDQDIKLEDADFYPDLVAAAKRYKASEASEGETDAADDGTKERTEESQATKPADAAAEATAPAKKPVEPPAEPSKPSAEPAGDKAGDTEKASAKPVAGDEAQNTQRATTPAAPPRFGRPHHPPGSVGRRPDRTRRLPGKRGRPAKTGGRKPN